STVTARVPFFVTCGCGSRRPAGNLVFADLDFAAAGCGYLGGQPGNPLGPVTFSNVRLRLGPGEPGENAWNETGMAGRWQGQEVFYQISDGLPYALLAEHVRGWECRDCSLAMAGTGRRWRAAVRLANVTESQLRAGLRLELDPAEAVAAPWDETAES
ncbi:MAG: hypothetical protein WC708_15080, partial [Lentisphaeria bacterium]